MAYTERFPERSGIKGEKPKHHNSKVKKHVIEHNRIREKPIHVQSGRGTLLIPEFMGWLIVQYSDKGLERHHFFSNDGGGKMDCFITIIGHELHAKIHHGANDGGVKNYIEMRGENILIVESMRLMQRWLDDALTDWHLIEKYQPLIDAVLDDVGNAINIAKSF